MSSIEKVVGRWHAVPDGSTVAEEDRLYPTGGFKSFGHFAHAVARGGTDTRPGEDASRLLLKAWEGLRRKRLDVKSPQGNFEESDPDGGVLVPPRWADEIYQRTYDQDQLLAYIDPIPVDGRRLTIPALKEDSRADGSRHGGVQGYWEGEADQYISTRPKLRTIGMNLHKLTVAIYATEELIQDSPQALENYLLPVAAAEINFKVNDAVINGTGAGMPLGILKSNSKIAVAARATQGASTIEAINLIAMRSRVAPAQRRGMVWLMNEDAEASLLRAYVASGQYATTAVVDYDDAGRLRVLGRPALTIEQCPTLGTEGDVIAFAPASYAAIVRRGVESFMSMHLRFDYDESMFKFRFRMDGQPKDDVPLTPYKGTATTSGIVTLSGSRT